MTLTTFAIFCGTTFLAALAPGLNVFLVSSFGMKSGFAAGFRAACGVFAANLLYALISVLGLAALLVSSRLLFDLVKFAGAGYLVWIGARLLWSALRGKPAGEGPDLRLQTRPFLQGFATHIANPKAILYWTALLPQFVPAESAHTLATLASLGLVAASIELLVLSGYAYATQGMRTLLSRAGVTRAIDACAGALFATAGIFLGFKTAWDRR